MKDIKIILGIFTLSIILGISGVRAEGEHYSFVGLKLKSNSGVSQTTVMNKTKKSLQYMNTISTTDSWTGKERAVSVQVVGAETSDWISAPKGSYVSWTNSSAQEIGGYYLRIKATKSTIASVSYNGTWFLDDTLITR